MNDEELYEAVLASFAREDMLERADEAYLAGDKSGLLSAVHEAKGTCGNAGLDRICQEAITLIARLRSPSFTQEELSEDYRRFSDAYTAVREGIREALCER